jgi:hypothetical protein
MGVGLGCGGGGVGGGRVEGKGRAYAFLSLVLQSPSWAVSVPTCALRFSVLFMGTLVFPGTFNAQNRDPKIRDYTTISLQRKDDSASNN